jgi:chromosome segregation and condensation protein ScpB
MMSKNRYENILFNEIQGLSERELSKIVKTIHFLKEEIIKEKHGNVADILKFSGIWKNMPRKELNIFSEILKEREKFSKGRTIIE